MKRLWQDYSSGTGSGACPPSPATDQSWSSTAWQLVLCGTGGTPYWTAQMILLEGLQKLLVGDLLE